MVVGIAMVKDEADIIGITVPHMADHCDAVIVADNGSTDGTREMLEDLPCEVLDDPEPGYYQSRKMSALAQRAADDFGAKWVVPFDADEIWQTEGRIASLLMGLPDAALLCEAELLDHVATPGYEVPSPWRRAQQLPLRKVACRFRSGLAIHQGNHGASYPRVPNHERLSVAHLLEVRHFPYRSPEQFISKARNGSAAYAATDLDESVGAHWRGYGRLSDDELRGVFHEYFFSADPERELVHDPASIRCLVSR